MSEPIQNLERHPGDAVNEYLDKRKERAREIAIFLAESKIWDRMLSNCTDYSSVMRQDKCEHLVEIVTERKKFANSNFNPECRPVLTPGIPKEFERTTPQYSLWNWGK